MPNQYDDLIQQDTAESARVNMIDAVNRQPDTEAKLQSLAKQYGMPVNAVRLRRPEIETRAKVESLDYDELAKNYPMTAGRLADSEFSAIAHDDVDNMRQFESTLSAWSQPKASVGSVLGGLGEALKFKPLVAGLKLAISDSLFNDGDVSSSVYRKDLERKAAQAQAQLDYRTPEFESDTARGVYSGAVSIAQNAPGVALSLLTRSTAPALFFAGLNTGAPSYSKYINRGGTRTEAAIGATAEAGVEILTELAPMGFIVNKFGKVGMKDFVAGLIGRDLPTEQIATIAQDAIDTAIANPDKTWQQYAQERPDAAYQTLIATLTQAGVMGTVSTVANRLSREENKAQQAEQGAQALQDIVKLAEASKVRQRSPEAFAQFAQSLTEEGVPNLYLDAKVLMQSENFQAIAEALPSVAEQIEEASVRGGDILVPTQEFISAVPGSEFAQEVIDMARTSPEAMSANEGRTFMQERGTELQTQIEEAVTAQQENDAWVQQRDQLQTDFATQLNSVKRFTPDANQQYASLLANFYSVQASRLGTTPQELAKRYGLVTKADGVAGGRKLDQAKAAPEMPLDSPLLDEVNASFLAAGGVGDLDESTDITAKSTAFAAMAKAEGWDVSDVGAKYFRVFKKLGETPDGYVREASFNVRVSDHANVNRGVHFGDAAINIEPEDGGGARDTFASALWKLRNADVNEDLDTTIGGDLASDYAFYQSAPDSGGAMLPATIEVDGRQRPTANSKGQPIAATEEGVRNFWKWFGDSKVVDADGRPLVVYHGTGKSFDTFEPNNRGVYFFTQSTDFAEKYAGGEYTIAVGDSPNLIPAYLASNNPFDFENKQHVNKLATAASLGKLAVDQIKKGDWSRIEDRTTLAKIKSLGFDAVYVKEEGVKNIATFSPEQIKSAIGNSGEFDPANPNILMQSAYHGTPYRGIDKFSTDNIGTGEGAQAYGWGLYFASKREVAEHYRKGLSYREIVRQFRDALPDSADTDEALESAENGELSRPMADVVKALAADDWLGFDYPSQAITAAFKELDAYDASQALQEAVRNYGGQLYKLEIPDDSEMLLWDKPLSEQPEAVQKMLSPVLERWYGKGNSEYVMSDPGSPVKSGKDLVIALGYNKSASDMLREVGIKGIKYLDGTSRSAGDGSYNYVIFSGEDVAITDQFYQQARGSINLPEDLTSSPAIISLFKGADLSTFIHESGHFFLEVQMDLAARIQADIDAGTSVTEGERGIVDDANKILEWFDAKGSETQSAIDAWMAMDLETKRPMHEQWARGFEAYSFEGNAPSIELQGAFQKFRSWLVSIYKNLKALNVDLTDDVRGVMDRMLATEQAIEEAQAARAMGRLFKTADSAGMTPEEFAAYHALGDKPTQAAIDYLQERGLRDMKWLANAKARKLKEMQKQVDSLRKDARIEARAQVMTQPVYRAWQFFKGSEPDASAKLSRAVLDEMFGGNVEDGTRDKYALLDWKRLTDQRMTSADGVHPDIFAGDFGFASGEEMVRALVDAEKPDVAIDALTDEIMLEKHGDLVTPEALSEAVEVAIHNDARIRFAATEYAVMERGLKGQSDDGKTTVDVLVSAAKQHAQRVISATRIKDLRPHQFSSSASRASKAAQKAMRSGDAAQAITEQRNNVVNLQMTKAALDAKQEMVDIRRKWSEFANRTDAKLGKGYDMDVVNAYRAIVAQYGVAEHKGKRASEYLDSVQSHDPEMAAALMPQVMDAERNAKPFADLTVEEARGLAESLEAMKYLAKRSRQSEVDGNLLDTQEIVEELRGRIDEVGLPENLPGKMSAVTPQEVAMAKFQTAIASARRVESWVGSMDGRNEMGPFRRFIFNGVKDAADAYRTDKAKYLKRYRDLFEAIAPTMKPQMIVAQELGGYTFGKDSGGSAVNEILHAILHTGNESNKRKLLLGRGWATLREDGSVDSTQWDRFIQRMANEGKITKAHMDFAQGVWDLLEDTKAGAQKAHREVYGRYFDEITANELVTPWGVYRGGYVPAKADPRATTDVKKRALMEEENASMAFSFPSTPKGFTKGRVEYNRPLMLDLRTLAQHIDQVLLFTHMEAPVRDVTRVIGKISTQLDRLNLGTLEGMIMPWLNRSARQQVITPIAGDAGLSRIATVMRSRAGMAAMFGNVINAVQQISGFSIAAIKVKPKLMLSATADFAKNPRKFARAVAEASPYMATRMDNEIAAMSDQINEILLNPSGLKKAQDWTMRHAYFLQSAIDNTMLPIIWTGAYNQAIENGQDHRNAVRLADSTVRETQGSTLAEDVSRIETGNAWVRLFTQFIGYFNMQANLLGTEFVKVARGEYGLRGGASRGLYVLMLGFMAPSVIAEAVVQAFRGGPEDEDDDGEYLDDWLAALFFYAPMRNATAMVPFVGQGINAVVNATNSKPYDDRLATSPAISMLEASARAPVSVYKAVAGDGSNQKAVRDVGTLLSMTVGLPGNLAARPIGYLAGVADDRIDPTGPADVARGLVTGVATEESKQ